MSGPDEALAFDFGGVGIRVLGLPGELGARLAREWSAYRASGRPTPLLAVRVGREAMPPPDGPFAPKAMWSRLGRGTASFGMQEGDVEVSASGDARVRLSTEVEDERSWFAFLNLLRAALAWCLPSRRGMMLHAAGIVVGGRAFVLAGSEGAGKSTFAALAHASGARVLSDDLVLLDGAGPRVEAVGAPFRSTWRGPHEAGRWDVAALLFPVHGGAPRLDAVPALVVRARVAANLPFVAEGIGTDPRIGEALDRLADSVPARELVFAREPSFVELLREFSS